MPAGLIRHSLPCTRLPCGWLVVFLLLGVGLMPGTVHAEPTTKKLVVATRHTPPFAIREANGSWSGISIDLWRDVATELALEYELREMTLDEMLDGLKDGSVDVAVAALTVTSEREKAIDFSHPFYTSGLGMAVKGDAQENWFQLVRRLFSPEVLKILGYVTIVLLASGVVVYLLERRRNPEHFGEGFLRGLGSGLWWTAVTVTTVGYGDKVPRTIGGRIIALLWMVAGIFLIATFTAAITSALTVNQLRSPVQGPEDLPRVRVAGVAHSTGMVYLSSRQVRCEDHATAGEALQALANGDTDVVVYDAPILRHQAHNDFPGTIQVLPRTFERQDYALGFPGGSPLREPCNRVLLRVIQQAQWQNLLHRYLGQTELK